MTDLCKTSTQSKLQNQLRRAGAVLTARPYVTLLILYLITVILRRMMVFAAGELPFIMPDEIRYMNIAHSIFTKSEILIRHQPSAYTAILYPLVLAPLYALPDNINIFRAMQYLNILMMHATIFPVYALARKVTGKKTTALFVAALTLLLPDTTLAKNIMTESLSYPLIALTFLSMYQMFQKEKNLGWAALSGIWVFLLYVLKPVYVVLGAAAFVPCAYIAFKEKSYKRLLSTSVFAGAMVAGYFLFQLFLVHVLHLDTSQLSLYGAQTAPFSWDHIIQTIKGLQPYAYFHLVAFGILPIVVLLHGLNRLDLPRKMLGLTVCLSLLFTIICTVYIIYVDELIYQQGIPLRVHVRYTAALFPLLITFLLTDEMIDVKPRVAGVIALTIVFLGFTQFPVSLLAGNSTYPVDSMMLSIVKYSSGSWDGYTMWLPLLLTAIVPIVVLSMVRGLSPRMRKIFLVVMVASLSINQYAAYMLNQNPYNGHVLADAKEVIGNTGDSAWMVAADGHEMWPDAAAVDVASRCEVPVLLFSDLVNNTNADGTISSVMPSDYANYVHTIATYSHDLPQYMIFETELVRYLALVGSGEQTLSSNGAFSVMPILSGTPWIHSGLFGLNEGWVENGSRFVLYDQALREQEQVQLQIQARAGSSAAYLYATPENGQTQVFELSNELSWHTILIDQLDPTQPLLVDLSAEYDNVYIETYLVG